MVTRRLDPIQRGQRQRLDVRALQGLQAQGVDAYRVQGFQNRIAVVDAVEFHRVRTDVRADIRDIPTVGEYTLADLPVLKNVASNVALIPGDIVYYGQRGGTGQLVIWDKVRSFSLLYYAGDDMSTNQREIVGSTTMFTIRDHQMSSHTEVIQFTAGLNLAKVLPIDMDATPVPVISTSWAITPDADSTTGIAFETVSNRDFYQIDNAATTIVQLRGSFGLEYDDLSVPGRDPDWLRIRKIEDLSLSLSCRVTLHFGSTRYNGYVTGALCYSAQENLEYGGNLVFPSS